jgi:putative FmdB family regulatory protein
MPIYEYQCTACGHHFDTIQTFKDEALVHCPVCNEPKLQKLISAPAFHLKGTGWYVTDFKNSTKSSSEGPGSQGEQAKEKEPAKPEETKKEVKAESEASKSSTSNNDEKG